MRVLYVSKASVVAAHRDKLRVLRGYVDLNTVVPDSWGGERPELTSHDHGVRELPIHFSGRNHFHFYRGLDATFADVRPDLVHLDEEPFSVVTLQGARLARRHGVPYLFFSWQNIHKRLPPPFAYLRRRVYETAAGGIAGSTEAAEVLRATGFGGPLAIIPQMGVDPDCFRPDVAAPAALRTRLDLPLDRILVGFVGRLVPEKGVGTLIEATALVTGMDLVLVGEGPDEARLRTQAARLGCDDRVHFAGHVPSLETPAWFGGLDALVLPSRTTSRWKEQFGRVLVEAMACAVPVVGSDSGEIPRVVGDAGIVFPEGDARALANVLRGLCDDPVRRRAVGCRGRARAVDLYSQERIGKETVRFYEQILGATRS